MAAAPRSEHSHRRSSLASASEASAAKPWRSQTRREAIAARLGNSPAARRARGVDPERSGVVRSFQPKPIPRWLTALLWLQRGSAMGTLVLAAAVLVTYGWTVYLQDRWGQEYERLEVLQKQERQLIAANEALKNQMAQQAEDPTTGLLPPDPSNTIFLAPAPERPAVKPKPTTPELEPLPRRPVGY
ncbi:MAG: hypothetical protein IGS38_11585 [Synechococcales cyanobacterium M58_A2018_015]|nr:hypothetical protein [Synechococcales cyanobacterium M58_A2018_015]